MGWYMPSSRNDDKLRFGHDEGLFESIGTELDICERGGVGRTGKGGKEHDLIN